MGKTLKNDAMKGYLLILLSGILWGTGGYWVIQLNAFGVGPAMTSLSAHLLSLIPIGLTILFKKGISGFKISKRGLIFAIILGIFGKGILKISYDAATIEVGQSTACVLLYTAPIFVTVISVCFLKAKVRWNTYIALALNLLGVILIVTGGNFREFNLSSWGIILGLIAAFTYALNIILGRAAGENADPLVASFYMMLTSTTFLFFVAKPWQMANPEVLLNGKFIFWAVINSVLTAAVPNMIYLQGLSYDIEVPKAGIISSVEVIVATFMGVFLLGENMNFVSVLGLLIMLGSIVLLNAKVEEVEIENFELKHEDVERVEVEVSKVDHTEVAKLDVDHTELEQAE